MINLAINGFGRIGRNILRALYEGGLNNHFKVVAINDLADNDTNAHLLQYDTTHGRFNKKVTHTNEAISVDGQSIPTFMQKDPENLPWRELEVDIVMECTGFFRTRALASKHLLAGAKKVLLSAPGKGLDATVVYGVNESDIQPHHTLISNASCTTNCLAHIAYAMHHSVGIVSGLANTIHAYTNTQNLLDSYHKDKRRGRAANYSMIPTSTGSAKAIGDVIPALEGRLDAVAVRVPTLNVSLLDFTFQANKATSMQALEEIFELHREGRAGVFDVCNVPLVSVDFNHDPNSCVVDFEQTRINDKLIKVQAWYDNEWGFSNRMLDTAVVMMRR